MKKKKKFAMYVYIKFCVGFVSFVYMYVFSVEIQLTRWEGWNPNNRSNFATLLYLCQAIIWVSNVTYRVFPFCVQFVRWEVIVVLHHSLSFLFISNNLYFQKCTNNWHEIDIKLIDWLVGWSIDWLMDWLWQINNSGLWKTLT